MGVFDNLIDNFSAKDLKSRVTGVIVMGFAVCALAVFGLYYLLQSPQEITISGVGRWAGVDGKAVVVSLDQENMKLLGDREDVRARFLDPAAGPALIEAHILSLNPAAPSVEINAAGLPESFSHLEKFDVELVLIDSPMWKMLWGHR
jgi:hypothetical protein